MQKIVGMALCKRTSRGDGCNPDELIFKLESDDSIAKHTVLVRIMGNPFCQGSSDEVGNLFHEFSGFKKQTVRVDLGEGDFHNAEAVMPFIRE